MQVSSENKKITIEEWDCSVANHAFRHTVTFLESVAVELEDYEKLDPEEIGQLADYLSLFDAMYIDRECHASVCYNCIAMRELGNKKALELRKPFEKYLPLIHACMNKTIDAVKNARIVLHWNDD